MHAPTLRGAHVNVAFIGECNVGKSMVCGSLLAASKQISPDVLRRLERVWVRRSRLLVGVSSDAMGFRAHRGLARRKTSMATVKASFPCIG